MFKHKVDRVPVINYFYEYKDNLHVHPLQIKSMNSLAEKKKRKHTAMYYVI